MDAISFSLGTPDFLTQLDYLERINHISHESEQQLVNNYMDKGSMKIDVKYSIHVGFI